MGEYILKDIVKKNGTGDMFEISSKATSREEIGNDIYPPAKRMMDMKGISYDRHRASQVTASDMEYYDYILIMDQNNMNNMRRMFNERYMDKVHFLLSFAGENRAVSDPWYTDDFKTAYSDILKGCEAFYRFVMDGERQ